MLSLYGNVGFSIVIVRYFNKIVCEFFVQFYLNIIDTKNSPGSNYKMALILIASVNILIYYNNPVATKYKTYQ